jgi:hypothetical protein
MGMYVGTNKIKLGSSYNITPYGSFLLLGEIPQNTHKNIDKVVYITHKYTLIYYHINYLALKLGHTLNRSNKLNAARLIFEVKICMLTT